jgi:N-acetylneuraminic acid mutarotase
MVVWGGYDETSNINADSSTGGRYDPASDTWSPMAVPGGLVGRRDHIGVWSGSEMLVWGGISGETVDGDGARYQPDTDTWTPIAKTGAPTARHRHVAVWTGSRMIVWGGTGSVGVPFAPLGDGALYDPSNDSWSPIATEGAPEARSQAIAVWTGDRMIVWGGIGTNQPLQSGGMYFPPL